MTYIPFGSGPTLPPPGGGLPQPTGGGDSFWGSLGQAAVQLGTAWVGKELGLTGGSASEPPSGESVVPGAGLQAPQGTGCSWPMVRGPGGTCIDLSALPPGGDPAVVGAGSMPPASGGYADGYGDAVRGYYGVALQPRVEARAVRKCPPGMVLGKDNLCYESLRKSARKWDPGMKPLMTGGDRKAIRRAASVAGKLKREQKRLKKAGRALEKVC